MLNSGSSKHSPWKEEEEMVNEWGGTEADLHMIDGDD